MEKVILWGLDDSVDQTKAKAPLVRDTIAKNNFSWKFCMGLPVV
jgi:hypothetical protein